MKNKLIKYKETVFRILDVKGEQCLIVDCSKIRMPYWIDINEVKDCEMIEETDLLKINNVNICNYDDLNNVEKKITNNRFGSISLVLNSIGDLHQRVSLIELCSKNYNVSIGTIRNRLWNYLVYQNICVLAPNKKEQIKQLTQDEENIRWALNRYYYNGFELPLKETYRRLLKDKYCDENSKIIENAPTYRQFYYYFSKTNSKTKQLISRKGKGKFLRNHRPLLGDGVREYCKTIGYGMFDSTVCDIYLINEIG